MVTMPGTPIDSYSPEGEAQTRAITAREPAPYKPEMGLQVKPDQNPYEAFRGDTDFAERSNVADVGWKERFIQHYRNAQQYGTPGINELSEIRDAEQGYVSGQAVGKEAGALTADFLREQRRERQAQFEGMKPAETFGDYAAATIGAVSGAVADPVSLMGPVVKLGTAGWRMSYPILSRILDHGVSNAAMNAALNATVQAEEYGADMREEVDWLSLGIDAAAGFGFGLPFGYLDGRAAKDFYAREAARGAPTPQPEVPPAPDAPEVPPLDTMGTPTPDQMQREFSAQDLAQAQEDLFGEVVGTRNMTPEQLNQLDDYLNGGMAGDIPQAEPETPGGLTPEQAEIEQQWNELAAGTGETADATWVEEIGSWNAPPVELPGNPVGDFVVPQERQPAPAPLPLDRTERQFSPSDLKVDAKRFQFKEGGDEAGVTDRLKGVKNWDPIKSGVTLVWEDLNGDFYIADGHQRHGLASRLEKEGQQPKIRAVVLREADGVTAEDARAIAAAKNIAEGTGNAIDAAKILRSRPDMGVDLPPSSALVRDAQGLASLSDDAFGMVINKKVPAGYAAQVGRLAPDPKTHAELLGLLAKEQPDNAIEAESMIRDALEAPAVQSTMEDMFGSAEVTQILFKERAQVLSAAATAIRKDRAAFATLVKEEARLTGAGNKLATQTNAERAAQDAEILATLQAQARRKGPVADALAAAAKRLKDGDSRQVVVRDFLDQLRRSGEAAGPDGRGAGPAGRAGEEGIAASLGGYRSTDQPAFRKWFGDSKVVDESGKPLVVYHGTASDFSEFKKVDAKHIDLPGYYFTPSAAVADGFSASASRKEIRDADGYIVGYDGANTIPVYLSIQNPAEINLTDRQTGVMTGSNEVRNLLESARVAGHDGAIIRGWSDGSGPVQYVAFDPTQIKSIFNRGTWDPSEPNIAFARRRPVQEGPGLFDAAPKAPGISPQMERVLTMSSGKMGAPDNIYGDQINEAVRNGWIAMQSGYTATGNSKTRYFITDAGRQVLAGGQPQPKPVERPTSMPERQAAFREEVERLRAEKAELERSIFAAIDKDGAFSAETADGRTIIVTKSLRDPSLYQITNIDRNGEATGHFDSRGTDLASDVRSTGVKLGVKLGVKPRAEAPPPSGGLFDTGADNKPQAVIPGAGKISDKRLAEMRAAAPMRAQRPQKAADIGLFGDEMDQQGFAFSAPNHPPATQVEMARAFQASQPARSFDELYEGGILQRRQDELAEAGKQIAAELGIIFKNPGIKKRATAEAKMPRKGYTSTAKLQDLVRAGFEVDAPDKADALVQRLADYFDVLDEGWASTPHGYFDRKIAVRFYDGTIGEIQVWEPQLAYAKMKGGGTELYTQSRDMPPGPERDRLEQAMVDLYQPIRDSLAPDWNAAVGMGGKVPNVLEKRSAMDASSGSTRAEAPTSTEFTSVQGSPGSNTDQARPSVQTAGRESQSQNLNTGTSSQSTVGPGQSGAQGDVSSQGTAIDPLTQPGAWRDADIMAVDETGKAVVVNAGDAVDFMVTRIESLRQLLECVNAG